VKEENLLGLKRCPKVIRGIRGGCPRGLRRGAPDADDRDVIDDIDAASEKGLPQIGEVVYSKGWVSFFSGTEVALNSNVKLLRSALKPASRAAAEGFRLCDFWQAEEPPVKFASGRLASFRGCNLKVIEIGDAKCHDV